MAGRMTSILSLIICPIIAFAGTMLAFFILGLDISEIIWQIRDSSPRLPPDILMIYLHHLPELLFDVALPSIPCFFLWRHFLRTLARGNVRDR
jgi:hypothetical protein